VLTQLQCSYQPAATSQSVCKVQSGQMQLQPRRQLPGRCCSSCRSRVTWLGTGAQLPCCNRQGWRGDWRGVKLAVRLCFGGVKCVGCRPQVLVILRSGFCTRPSFASCTQAFASCTQAFVKLHYLSCTYLAHHELEIVSLLLLSLLLFLSTWPCLHCNHWKAFGRAPSFRCRTGLLSKSPTLPMQVLCNVTQL